MNIKELNIDIIFEKNISELYDDLERAKKNLKDDIDNRISLIKIKEFVKKWQFFTNKFNISKEKITIIEARGKELLKFLNARVDALENVENIDKSIIKPMKDYLVDFADDIEYHIMIQKENYKQIVGK